MSRPVHTSFYMLAIIGAFFSLSLIYQSCGKKKVESPTPEELEEQLIDTAELDYDEDEFFEDDDSSDDSREIDYTDSSEDTYTPAESTTSYTTTSSRSSASNADYMVVAGNYLVEGNANEMVRKLRSSGYDGAEKVVFDLSRYYTVLAGSYNTRSLANSISSELNGIGIENYVIRRKQ